MRCFRLVVRSSSRQDAEACGLCTPNCGWRTSEAVEESVTWHVEEERRDGTV